MERFTNNLSLSAHLLAAAEGVDRIRRLRPGLGALPAPSGGAGTTRLAGVLRRRHVLPRKKRGSGVGKTKRGKGTKLMTLVESHGVPFAVDVDTASSAEVTIIESLLEQRVLQRRPRRLVYDRAADSDPLRERLRQRRIELICPHRRNRRRPRTQDGRALRRYKRRWKVERTISWIQNFRRLVVRYERHLHLFLGFAQLACLYTTTRQL